MALTWIDEARANLSVASNNYIKIQRELDKYNKIFEVYSRASPETQQRAASVMRQAMDEYNGLKKQQEENSTKIFQARQWIDYYNKNNTQTVQQEQTEVLQPKMLEEQMISKPSAPEEEIIPVINTTTPWVINNNTPSVNVEVVESTPINNQAPSSPATVWMVNYYQTPKSINMNTNVSRSNRNNAIRSNYWPGSIAPMPWIWWLATLNTTPIYNKNRSGSSLANTINNYIRNWAKYIYRYLRK